MRHMWYKPVLGLLWGLLLVVSVHKSPTWRPLSTPLFRWRGFCFRMFPGSVLSETASGKDYQVKLILRDAWLWKEPHGVTQVKDWGFLAWKRVIRVPGSFQIRARCRQPASAGTTFDLDLSSGGRSPSGRILGFWWKSKEKTFTTQERVSIDSKDLCNAAFIINNKAIVLTKLKSMWDQHLTG